MSTPSRRSVLTSIVAGATGTVLLSAGATPSSATPSALQPATGGAAGRKAAANKALVVYFVDQLFNRGNLAAADRLARTDYIQHNPQFPTGRDALKQGVAGLKAAFPDSRLIVHRVLAEANLVVVHSNFVLTPGTKGTAVFDIFRVQHGKIAEHWDVTQPVPDTTVSGNDMFATVSTPRRPRHDPRVSGTASKRIVLGMFTQAFLGRDLTAFDRYVAGPYYQHNPQAPNGIEAPKQLLSQAFTSPFYDVSIKRVIAEGDYVAIHHHFTVADDNGLAVVDLYRVRNGKVVEHWDVLQAVPDTAANDNTMF